MIRARCLHRSAHRFTNSRVDLASSPQSGRKFYSATAGTILKHELAANPLTRPPKLWRLVQSPLQRLSGNSTSRFASTTPIPPPRAEVQPGDVPPHQTTTPAEEQLLPTSFDGMIDPISPPVHEHLGFLKEMGLDYGWGPTAFVETILEHVHVYLGTPWWASIGVTILIIRAAVLKFYIDTADCSARRQIVKPYEDEINTRFKAARAEEDRNALRAAWMDRKDLHKRAGIIWWKSLLPLVQLPIGFGTFRLMRAMATLPVPGFDTGGLLWISDLTIPDPYYFIPIATAWAYYFAFKQGGEAGSTAMVSETTRKVFLYAMPIFGGFIMIWWPAGLQLTFFVTACVSAAQATMFKSPGFRNFVGIHPLPAPAAPAPKPQYQPNPRYQAPSSTPSNPESPTGIFGSMKGAVSDIIKAGEKFAPSVKKEQAQKGRLTTAERRHADAYEEKRQKELAREAAMKRSSAQARFEREQEEMTQDRERKERLQRRAEKKAARRQ